MRFVFYRTGKKEQIINVQEFPGGKPVCKTTDEYANLILNSPRMLDLIGKVIQQFRGDPTPEERLELIRECSILYTQVTRK